MYFLIFEFIEKIAARQAQLQTDLTNIDSRRQFNQQETAITDETGFVLLSLLLF